MTNSRETDRRKLFKDRAKFELTEPSAGADLRSLCIVQGCLNPRRGTNLCRRCDNETDLKAESVR